MRTNDEIIQIIKFETSKKGYTITQLGKQIGMSKSGISMIFNNKRQFPVNKVSDFARALDVTPEYILGFDLHGNKVDDPQHTSKLTPNTEDPIADFCAELLLNPNPKMEEFILMKPSDDELDSVVAFLKTTRSLKK